MYKVINRTGKAYGKIECIESIYSDCNLETFVSICKQLKCSQSLSGLREENEVEFVKAFYPSFDEKCQIASISTVVKKDDGYPAYRIELWQFNLEHSKQKK